MLESLTLTDFKAFARQELRLAPFTLLTGLNSSGKSSVLQSLALLRQSYESGDLAPVGDRDAGLLLNEELVQLGTGQDVRHESYDDTGPHIAFTVRGGGAAEQWTALYEREADHLKLLREEDGQILEASVEPAVLLPTLFGPGFQYPKADRVSPQVSFPRSHHAVTPADSSARTASTQSTICAFTTMNPSRRARSSSRTPLPTASSGRPRHGCSSSARGGSQGGGHRRHRCRPPQPPLRLRCVGLQQRPTNIGFGLTYVLPIVVACLSAKPGTLILLENPEAHPHPQGQTWMAYLASAAAASGVQIVMETHSDHVLNGLRLTSQGLGNREEGSPRCCGTGTRSGRRGASGGSQGCSLRSSASADPVAQGSRTARSSPSRHTWLSQPRAPSRRGRSARSGCWSRSRSRISSSVISVVVAAGGQR